MPSPQRPASFSASAMPPHPAMNPSKEYGGRGGSATTYDFVAVIGTGAYGTVYKARALHSEDGEWVAIKKIRISTDTEEGMPMCTIREIAMLKQLEKFEHPNIVKLHEVMTHTKSQSEMRLMLVFEYIDQDLAQYLERCPSPGLGPDRIRDLQYQMLLGVDFLHSNRIVHRDLKPQNVLVTSSGRVKLADFGLARIYAFQMALTSIVVTLWYRAPEVLLQDKYCTAVDLWSCGCIMAELYTRKPLFLGQSDIDQMNKIFEITGLPPRSQWPENISLPYTAFPNRPRTRYSHLIPELDEYAEDLLEKLLMFNQSDRISAQEALKHPYFLEPQDNPPQDTAAGASATAPGDTPTPAAAAAAADFSSSDLGNTSMSSSVDTSGSNLDEEGLGEEGEEEVVVEGMMEQERGDPDGCMAVAAEIVTPPTPFQN